MIQLSPEMVLGKDVYDATGDLVGAVVDVGVHDLRRVKFLLVESGGPLRRLNLDQIEAVGTAAVVLKGPVS